MDCCLMLISQALLIAVVTEAASIRCAIILVSVQLGRVRL
jgi:hypothetical protein